MSIVVRLLDEIVKANKLFKVEISIEVKLLPSNISVSNFVLFVTSIEDKLF